VLAITALPVLGRILVDLRIQGTPTGVIALSAAAVGDGVAWTVLAVILATSHLSGTGQMATTAGLPPGQAMQVGALMNCRGVTELVIATIGVQYGLIILVLVAVTTTRATGPLMRALLRRQPAPCSEPVL